MRGEQGTGHHARRRRQGEDGIDGCRRQPKTVDTTVRAVDFMAGHAFVRGLFVLHLSGHAVSLGGN